MKHRLGDDGKGNQATQLQAGDRHHWHKRVFQSMPEVDGSIGQAARTSKLDVVRAQNLQHFRAHQTHDQGQLEDGQGDCRQNNMMPTFGRDQTTAPPADLHNFPPTKTGEPSQPNRENQNQSNADQEGRERNSQQRDRHENLAQKTAPPQSRIHTHRNTNDQGNTRSDQSQFKGGRKTLSQQPRNFCALTQAQTEFALHCIAQKAGELHDKGLIEPQISAQLPNLFGRGILPKQKHDRVTHILKEHEGDKSHGDHHDHGLYETLENESKHGWTSSR